MDVTVTSPLAASNVEGAVQPGASLTKAVQRKLRDTEEACRLEGLEFLPFAVETLGGFHTGAVVQVKQIADRIGEEQGLWWKRGYQPTVRQIVPHTATLQRHDAGLSPSR